MDLMRMLDFVPLDEQKVEQSKEIEQKVCGASPTGEIIKSEIKVKNEKPFISPALIKYNKKVNRIKKRDSFDTKTANETIYAVTAIALAEEKRAIKRQKNLKELVKQNG